MSNSHIREFSTDAGSIRLNVGKANEVSVQYSTNFIDMAGQWMKLNESQQQIKALGKEASKLSTALRNVGTTNLSQKEQFGLAYSLAQKLVPFMSYYNSLPNVSTTAQKK
jgi:hypothetical protein